MARIILVHGAWSCAAAWDSLVPALRRAGHDVHAVTLPGHGDDPTPPDQVGLSEYAAHVADVLRAGDAAVLIGHSMGGMVISAAAELVPDKVRQLIYVAAFLPRDGQSLVDLIKQQEAPGIMPAVRRGPEKGATTLDPDKAAEVLFPDATPQQQARALAQLTRQPNRGQTEPARLTEARFGTVPRSYVICTQDRTVTPALQRAMLAASPETDMRALDSGHFPQLSAPAALAEILSDLIEEKT